MPCLAVARPSAIKARPGLPDRRRSRRDTGLPWSSSLLSAPRLCGKEEPVSPRVERPVVERFGLATIVSTARRAAVAVGTAAAAAGSSLRGEIGPFNGFGGFDALLLPGAVGLAVAAGAAARAVTGVEAAFGRSSMDKPARAAGSDAARRLEEGCTGEPLVLMAAVSSFEVDPPIGAERESRCLD